MRRLLLLIALLLLPAAPAQAFGRLDTRFSGDGLTKVTHDHGTIPVAVAAAPGGAVYVAVEGRFAVLKVKRSGALDRRFGRAGVATVAAGPDWDGNARIEALGVRPSDGAVVVAGRARGDVAIVAAFDGTGRPLTSFGAGGRVLLPMQAFTTGASRLLFDPLTGAMTWAVVRSAYGPSSSTPDVVWLRLASDGSLASVVRTPLAVGLSAWRAGVGLWRTPDGAARLALGGATSFLDLGPDATAAAVVPTPALVADPGVRIAPIGRDALALEGGASTVLRRRADGGAGPATWSRALGRRFGVPEIVVPDHQGGAYVAGRALRGARTRHFRYVLTVMRVRTGGRIDRRFGRKGVLDIRLRSGNIITTPRLLVDRVRHRLWVVADAGSGFFDIREDFGGHDVLVAAIRTR